MDDSLLNDYIDKVLLPLYPNISKHATFDTSGKFLPPLAEILFNMHH
jgi:hypothetical protein